MRSQPAALVLLIALLSQSPSSFASTGGFVSPELMLMGGGLGLVGGLVGRRRKLGLGKGMLLSVAVFFLAYALFIALVSGGLSGIFMWATFLTMQALVPICAGYALGHYLSAPEADKRSDDATPTPPSP